MMNSGSESTSNPLSHKPDSAVHLSRHHPVRNPSSTSSPSAVPSKSSPPRSALEAPASATLVQNGDTAPEIANGHDESEAETEILSGDEESRSRAKRIVKQENGDDDDVLSPALTTRSESARSSPVVSRRSSVNGESAGGKLRRGNGDDKKKNSKSNGSAKSPTNGKVRSLKTKTSTVRAQSADASITPTSDNADRPRQSLSVEPRKRKLSNDHQHAKIEPPRQRPRLDSSTKPLSQHSKRRSSSPPTPGSAGIAVHNRSSSAHSGVAKVKSRKKRDISSNSQPSDNKRKWADGSSDSSTSSPTSSPRSNAPPVPYLAPPRSSRSAQRALASPARTVLPHVRRADKYGTTPLAKACERGDFAQVKKAYELAPDALDQPDNGGFTPLQKAALGGHSDIVQFLLEKGCRRNCHSKDDRDTPLIDAVENGHLEVVKLLLRSGVNPHHANRKGDRAIDAVDHSQEYASDIERELKKAMADYQGEEDDHEDQSQESPVIVRRDRNGTRPDLLYKEISRDNLLKYATSGDVEGVGLMLSNLEPDLACAVAAARGGHDEALNIILATPSQGLETDPDPGKYEETPMIAAIGRGHLKVVRLLLDQDNFNPCRRTKKGQTYYEIAEERHGPRWQAEVELLKERYDDYKDRKNAKKKRALETKSSVKQPSSSKPDFLSPKSPKSPRFAKSKIKVEKPDEDRRQKRPLSGKDYAAKETLRRKRPVVEDDSSQDDASDDGARRPSKSAMRKRANSTISRTSLSAKTKDEPHLAAGSRSEETKGRPGRKPKESRLAKNHENGNSAADVEMKDAAGLVTKTSPESSKQGTPDNIRVARKAESEAKAKKEEEDRARKAAEDKIKQEAEAKAKAEAEAKIKAEKEAEARAKEEAEARAREAAQILQREREEKERKLRERRERLESLPVAIRNAMEKGRNRPLQFTASVDANVVPELGITLQFLPIYVFEQQAVDPETDPSSAADLWMLSFHVVGIFGFPELGLDEFPSWRKLPVTDEQRIAFLKSYDITQLAQDHAWPQMGDPGFDFAWAQKRIQETRKQFLNMQPLSWVRFSDFEEAVRSEERLAGLKIRTIRSGALTKPSSRKSFAEIFGIKEESGTPEKLISAPGSVLGDETAKHNGEMSPAPVGNQSRPMAEV